MLKGKRLVITGVLNQSSIAYTVARLAQEQGAEVVLTSFGRAMSLTKRVAARLPVPADTLELDASNASDFERLTVALEERWGGVDGALHSIAFGPGGCFGDFLGAPWEDVSVALQVSAYSMKSLAASLAPLMRDGGSIVGLDFDATVAWPGYDWMGVAKAALESVTRYLAHDLGPNGIRVNLVSAGPLRTFSSHAVGGFDAIGRAWRAGAPLGWDAGDPEPVARTCIALLSDWLPATTGEIVHADGGAHALGARSAAP